MAYGVLGVLALLFAAMSSHAQTPSDRIALVIGNSAYRHSPLINPRNDADAMADLLTKAGFSVDRRIDATRQTLMEAVNRFGQDIKNPDVRLGLFYYAGHGVQLNWRNYLIPVDSKIGSAEDIRQQSVDVSSLFQHMATASGKNFLTILDACRDDPFSGSYRVTEKGLSQFDAPVGSLLAYSTSPGKVASDGEGANGLYTSHLLREMSVKGSKIEDVFKRVRLSVRMASNSRQIPWESTSLEGDLYLFPSDKAKLTEAQQDELFERELRQWLAVKSSSDIPRLVEFIREFPSGSTSELAQSRLNRLLDQQAQSERQRLDIAAAEQDRPKNQESIPDDERSSQLLTLPSTPFYLGYDEFRRTFDEGDEFKFQVVDLLTKLTRPLRLKVTKVNLAEDRVEYNDGEYSSDTMGNTSRTIRGGFDTPRQFYPAELFVGKRWRTVFKQVRPSGLTYTYRYDIKVAGRERVTVPAGTFDTYRIEARGYNLQLNANLIRNIWVTPGIPVDIAHETQVRLRNGVIEVSDRHELVSVSSAKGVRQSSEAK